MYPEISGLLDNVGVSYREAYNKVTADIKKRAGLIKSVKRRLADPRQKQNHPRLRKLLAKYQRFQISDVERQKRLAKKLGIGQPRPAPTPAPRPAPPPRAPAPAPKPPPKKIITVKPPPPAAPPPKHPAAPSKPRIPPPTPAQTPRQRAAEVNKTIKQDTKVLAQTKKPSRVIPLSNTTYLKFYPAVPKRNLAASYAIMKKTAGADRQVGSILIIKPRRNLIVKTRPPFTVSRESLQTARSRMPPPYNAYSFRMKGKPVPMPPPAPPPPPISPYVPPEAPPDAQITDYMGPQTPPEVQQELAQNLPPPPGPGAPQVLPAPETFEVPPPPEPPPRFGLPEVPETEADLDRFFGYRMAGGGVGNWMLPAAGVAAFGSYYLYTLHKEKLATQKAEAAARRAADAQRRLQNAQARIDKAQQLRIPLDEDYERLERQKRELADVERDLEKFKADLAKIQGERIVMDTRDRTVPTHSEWTNPPSLQIMAGFDDFDDADEELAEMRASGFSKGWWQ